MKVSFVIPAYNEHELIGKCIESINKEIERSGFEAEIVIADNNSTDDTREIAARYPRVKVVEEHWKGANRARQTGFKASHGEFIASLDADVIVPSGWLTTAMREMERNSNTVAISGPFIYYDLPLWERALIRIFLLSYPVANFFVQNVFHAGAVLQGGNYLVRREALERIGGHNTAIEFYGDDTDTGSRLSKIGKVKWTLALPIYTSGRRLKGEGALKTAFKYLINFFSVILAGTPVTKSYQDIRPTSLGDRRESPSTKQ